MIIRPWTQPISNFMFINSLATKLSLIVYLLLLAGCSHLREHWPAEVPNKNRFLAVYQQDKINKAKQTQDEYLLWVERFYMGWEVYRRGWLKTTNELLEQIESPADQRKFKKKMDQLGFAISSEWAKKSKTRRIFTRHVSIWGNALIESLDRGEHEQLIEKVQQDVNALLAHKLEPDLITASRYYPEDESNPFL